jgi:hypothetical protein
VQDELWMRTWNDGHERFSADLHRGTLALRTLFRQLDRGTAPRTNVDETDSVAPVTIGRESKRRRKAG